MIHNPHRAPHRAAEARTSAPGGSPDARKLATGALEAMERATITMESLQLQAPNLGLQSQAIVEGAL